MIILACTLCFLAGIATWMARDWLKPIAIWAALWVLVGVGYIMWFLGFRLPEDRQEARR
jgi:hypothetical protein